MISDLTSGSTEPRTASPANILTSPSPLVARVSPTDGTISAARAAWIPASSAASSTRMPITMRSSSRIAFLLLARSIVVSPPSIGTVRDRSSPPHLNYKLRAGGGPAMLQSTTRPAADGACRFRHACHGKSCVSRCWPRVTERLARACDQRRPVGVPEHGEPSIADQGGDAVDEALRVVDAEEARPGAGAGNQQGADALPVECGKEGARIPGREQLELAPRRAPGDRPGGGATSVVPGVVRGAAQDHAIRRYPGGDLPVGLALGRSGIHPRAEPAPSH